ncbi:AraC family transcriptional regulator [Flavihumibacter sp. UBA7668]|uniref:AraC family transcriptional regulator n=1 Tax=Flavihumibacter sp. UBA7668 TaxID=1946542 RepID=UPI0025BAE0B2|nr:AraC family transcriptional regulator [Flavihumibacter sp. UBA7668]
MDNFQRQFTLALLGYAVQRDLDPAALSKASGINFRELSSNPGYSINPEQSEELWKNASHMSGDSLFGLHFGESLQLAALGVVGQIIQTSSTVSEALSNACALVKMTSAIFEMQIQHERKCFFIHLLADRHKAVKYPYSYRHLSDCLLVFVIHEMDGLLFEKVKPTQVGFPYFLAEPYEYARVFRCPKIGKSNELLMEFSAHYLDIPILSANYELQQILLKKVISLLAPVENKGSWKLKIFNYLLTNSYLKTLSLEAVAHNFNTTERALQRKLKEEGSSYSQIVDAVRKKLAVNYLENDNFSLKDIGHMLGYTEQTAFLRAFKRWTGLSPSQYKSKTN